jgi:hypothetical protein
VRIQGEVLGDRWRFARISRAHTVNRVAAVRTTLLNGGRCRASLFETGSYAASERISDSDHDGHVQTGAEYVRDEEDGGGNAGDAGDRAGQSLIPNP